MELTEEATPFAGFDFEVVVQVECSICLRPFQSTEVHVICANQHQFCAECIVSYAKFQIESGCVPVCCPSKSCEQPCLHERLESLLPRDLSEKLSLFLKKNTDQSFSPCPHCNAENFGSRENPMIKCAGCSKTYCFVHSSAHNENMTCAAYEARVLKENKKVNSMPKSIKNCPKCDAPSMRISGCNGVRCQQCGGFWCFACETLCDGHSCSTCHASYMEAGEPLECPCSCSLPLCLTAPLWAPFAFLLGTLLYMAYFLGSCCCCLWCPWTSYKIFKESTLDCWICCRIPLGMCYLTCYPFWIIFGEFWHFGLYENYPFEDDFNAIHFEQYFASGERPEKICIPCCPCIEI